MDKEEVVAKTIAIVLRTGRERGLLRVNNKQDRKDFCAWRRNLIIRRKGGTDQNPIE
jgi:hypothetical protein